MPRKSTTGTTAQWNYDRQPDSPVRIAIVNEQGQVMARMECRRTTDWSVITVSCPFHMDGRQ